jgi:hypothetical protein
MPLIFVFGIAELAMNAQVFDIFGSARFETIVMSLILSFAIPVSGHFWGRFLREDQKERPLIMLSIGTLAVIIFSLYSGFCVVVFARARLPTFEIQARLHGGVARDPQNRRPTQFIEIILSQQGLPDS